MGQVLPHTAIGPRGPKKLVRVLELLEHPVADLLRLRVPAAARHVLPRERGQPAAGARPIHAPHLVDAGLALLVLHHRAVVAALALHFVLGRELGEHVGARRQGVELLLFRLERLAVHRLAVRVLPVGVENLIPDRFRSGAKLIRFATLGNIVGIVVLPVIKLTPYPIPSPFHTLSHRYGSVCDRSIRRHD